MCGSTIANPNPCWLIESFLEKFLSTEMKEENRTKESNYRYRICRWPFHDGEV